MTSEQQQLARRRLWLGITNVGSWVLAAAVGLSLLVDGRADAFGSGWLMAAGVMAVAAQALFDIIGGTALMTRPRPTVTAFLHGWVRGVLAHTLVLGGVAVMSAMSLRLTGGFGAGIVLATTTLALVRRLLLRAVGGVTATARTRHGEGILTVAVDDPAFTGGADGLGRRARSLLPASWLDALPEAELAAELCRRRWQVTQALPARAFVLVLVWNLLGTSAGTYMFQLADRPPSVALLGHACWMTLWAFASLLVLPAMSRTAVFAADRAAADAGHDIRAWVAHFPALIGEDGSASTAMQTVFYPIPSAAMRLHQLAHAPSGFVPGSLARNNLYYSWATLTLLGRAVHCNVGRPALWVYPPSA